jgi:hypothetical protein
MKDPSEKYRVLVITYAMRIITVGTMNTCKMFSACPKYENNPPTVFRAANDRDSVAARVARRCAPLSKILAEGEVSQFPKAVSIDNDEPREEKFADMD